MRLFKPELKSLAKLLPGIPTGEVITNLVGKHLAGKSLLALQLAYEYCKESGGGILILDVDAGARLFVEEWKNIFEKRYGYKAETYILPCFNLKRVIPAKTDRKMHIAFDLKIYEVFGVKAVAYLSAEEVIDRESKIVKVSGGKTEFIPYSICDEIVREYIEEKNVKAVIVDSFSQVFKDCFIGTQSLGERARAEDFLYGRIKEVGLKYPDTLIICNHHQTLNPLTGSVDIAGGAAVIQNSKLALYIERMESKKYYGLSRVYLFRYPNIPPWSKYVWLMYSDIGFIDPLPEYFRELGLSIEGTVGESASE